MLDAVEQVLDDSVANPGLSSYLAQAGVQYLVVRNDLAVGAGAPPPIQVYDELAATPGITPVVGFGPRHNAHFNSVHVSLRAIEIYRISGTVRTVTSSPVANSVVVSGGSNALLAMDEANLEPGDRAVLLAGDGGVSTPNQTWVDTDSSPRVSVEHGAIRNNTSYVLTPGEDSPVTGSPPTVWTIVPGSQHQTVAKYLGVKDITASSFGSSYLIQVPAEQPAAALDSSPSTAWVANVANNSIGQWIRVDFTKPVDLTHLDLQPTSSAQTPRVKQVMIQTARGSLRQNVDPSGGLQNLRTPMGKTLWVKVTFTKVAPARKKAQFDLGAGIQQLTIPGISAEKAEVVPTDELKRFSTPSSRVPLYIFTSSTPVSPFVIQDGGDDEEPRMERVFTTPRKGIYDISGTVDVRPGPQLAAFLKLLGPTALTSEPLNLPCGKGPSLTIDNKVLPTEVTGRFGGLSGFPPLLFTVCGKSNPIVLPKGTNVLVGNTGGFLKVVTVTLRPALSEPYASASPARSTRITSWGQERRTVAVGAGAATYLVVRQNFNTGWTAQFKGQTLKPVEINGWQQAWVVPKGSAGTVTLSYGPDLVYQIGLIVGGVLVLLLLGIALWPSNQRDIDPPFAARPGPSAIILATIAIVVLVTLGGVLALILPMLLALAWTIRARRWLGMLALVAYAAGGVVVAHHVGRYPGADIGAFGRPAQIASVVALAAVFSALIAEDKWWSKRKRDPEARPE
jgi:arabinofuranan 3-O-arabinosyltransferase